MKYFVLASLLCLSACGDDNDNKNNETPQNLAELTVDASEISIAQGDTRTVKITSGNGEYVVTSANEEVVTAEVDGDLVTLTAVEGKNNAQGVVYVRDKYYQRAKILVNTDIPITDICYETGFSNFSYFIKTFKKNHNDTPGSYRKKFSKK